MHFKLKVIVIIVALIVGLMSCKKENPSEEDVVLTPQMDITSGNKWDTVAVLNNTVKDFEIHNGELWAGGEFFQTYVGSNHGYSGKFTSTYHFELDFYMAYNLPSISLNNMGIHTLYSMYDTLLFAGGLNLSSGSWDGAFSYTTSESWMNQFPSSGGDFYAYHHMPGTNSMLVAGGDYPTFNNICQFIPRKDIFAPLPVPAPVGNGFNDIVRDLVVYNGDLYACGDFTMSGTLNVNYIAKLDSTGWVKVGNGLSGHANRMEVFDGNLFVTGEFTDASGVQGTSYIAMWDGFQWQSVGGGLNDANGGGVGFDLTSDNNYLVVVGNFNQAGSISVDDIALFGKNGIWESLGDTIVGEPTATGIINNKLYVASKIPTAIVDSSCIFIWD